MAEFIASVIQELEELHGALFGRHARLVERLRARHKQLTKQDLIAKAGRHPLRGSQVSEGAIVARGLSAPPAMSNNVRNSSFLEKAELVDLISVMKEHPDFGETSGLPDEEKGIHMPEAGVTLSLAYSRSALKAGVGRTSSSSLASAASTTSSRKAKGGSCVVVRGKSLNAREQEAENAGTAQTAGEEDDDDDADDDDDEEEAEVQELGTYDSAEPMEAAFGEDQFEDDEGNPLSSGQVLCGLSTLIEKRGTMRGNSALKMAPRKDWDLGNELAQRAQQDTEGDDPLLEQTREELEIECQEIFQTVRDFNEPKDKHPAQSQPTLRRGSSRRAPTVECLSSGLSDEQQERRWMRHCPQPPFNPHSGQRLPWDMGGMALVMYEMISIPILLFLMPTTDSFSSALDMSINVYWTLDIPLAFLTMVEKEGELKEDFRVIAKQYARTWFPMDLVMVLPEWIIFFAQSGGRAGLSIMRLLKISRVVRLLRVLKMENAIRKQLSRVNSSRALNLLKLGQMILGFVLLNHWIACIWFFIGQTDDGWLSVFTDSSDIGNGYTLALHWAVSNFHGTADVSPGNVLERVFAVSMQVAGLLGLSIFVSTSTNIILQERQSQKRYHDRMGHLRMYFLHHKVPSQLVVSVKSHLKSATDEEEFMDDISVLQGLPDSLQKNVLYEARSPIIERHWLFAWLKDTHHSAFRAVCHSSFHSLRWIGGAIVFEFGDASEKLIFIEDGHMRYIEGQASTKRHARLSTASQQARKRMGTRVVKNMWICELALWVQGWQCKGDLMAVAHSSGLCIDSSAFAQDLKNFPDARIDIIMYARGFLRSAVTADPYWLSDLWKPAQEEQEVISETITPAVP